MKFIYKIMIDSYLKKGLEKKKLESKYIKKIGKKISEKFLIGRKKSLNVYFFNITKKTRKKFQ